MYAESSWKPKIADVYRIFLETENCLLDACDTDTCHIKTLSI
jgi:hypothetical protein